MSLEFAKHTIPQVGTPTSFFLHENGQLSNVAACRGVCTYKAPSSPTLPASRSPLQALFVKPAPLVDVYLTVLEPSIDDSG